MIIAHASDTHNHPSQITAIPSIADVILLTGDILDNRGRGEIIDGHFVPSRLPGSGIVYPNVERSYQRDWFRKVAKKWAPVFGDRPVVYVPGNHDYIDIAEWLCHYGCKPEQIHTISERNPFAVVNNKIFAGFREIPWISGEWMGEIHDFTDIIDQTFACDPDILVTHAPPAGILDGIDGYGIKPLMTALAYSEHKVTHHFFGHEHSCGGETVEEMGIQFINGACHMIVHKVV